MKEAVSARNAFAAAHSAYAMSLKNTGAALSDYASGEVQHPSSSVPTTLSGSSAASTLPQPPVDPFPPPPPPLPNFPQAPLKRAVTMPEMSFPKPDMKHPDAILEEENEDDLESESTHGLKHRSSRSSGGGVGNRSGISHREVVQEDELPKPPSPPRTPPQNNRDPPAPPPPHSGGLASWDYFFPSMENVPGPTLAEVDEDRVEREEYERKVLEERAKISEIDSKPKSGSGSGVDGDGPVAGASSSGAGRSGGKEEELDEVAEKPPELPPQPSQAPARVKRGKQVVPAEGKRRGNSNVNLLKIFGDLDDCFLKASESAHEVSKMLEAARLHYHSNFADNRGKMCKCIFFPPVICLFTSFLLI